MKRSIRVLMIVLGTIACSARGESLGTCLNAPQFTWTSGGQNPWSAEASVSHDGVDAAHSGLITDNQETWVEAQLTGPGILTFWWKVSSEQDFDFLEFSLNSELQTRISGEVDWKLGFFPIPAGAYTARWRYVKDADSSNGADTAWLDQVGFQPTFSLATGVDAPALAVVSSGDKPFFGETNVTHDGVDAVQSGVIDNSETSRLETTVTGPGTLTFWWKISSEQDYDWFNFSIAGVLKKHISGEVDWMKEAYDLPAGAQTISWEYFKDSSAGAGQDAGWVDQVHFSAGNSTPVFGLSAIMQANHTCLIQLSGVVTGVSYRIQTSSNLVDWAPWTQVTATNSQASVLDSTAGSSPKRFYRAVSP